MAMPQTEPESAIRQLWKRISGYAFYYTKSASYETARIGTLRLVPSEDAIRDLSIDYDHMRDMVYGEKPTFDEIMDSIAKLEGEINSLV